MGIEHGENTPFSFEDLGLSGPLGAVRTVINNNNPLPDHLVREAFSGLRSGWCKVLDGMIEVGRDVGAEQQFFDKNEFKSLKQVITAGASKAGVYMIPILTGTQGGQQGHYSTLVINRLSSGGVKIVILNSLIKEIDSEEIEALKGILAECGLEPESVEQISPYIQTIPEGYLGNDEFCRNLASRGLRIPIGTECGFYAALMAEEFGSHESFDKATEALRKKGRETAEKFKSDIFQLVKEINLASMFIRASFMLHHVRSEYSDARDLGFPKDVEDRDMAQKLREELTKVVEGCVLPDFTMREISYRLNEFALKATGASLTLFPATAPEVVRAGAGAPSLPTSGDPRAAASTQRAPLSSAPEIKIPESPEEFLALMKMYRRFAKRDDYTVLGNEVIVSLGERDDFALNNVATSLENAFIIVQSYGFEDLVRVVNEKAQEAARAATAAAAPARAASRAAVLATAAAPSFPAAPAVVPTVTAGAGAATPAESPFVDPASLFTVSPEQQEVLRKAYAATSLQLNGDVAFLRERSGVVSVSLGKGDYVFSFNERGEIVLNNPEYGGQDLRDDIIDQISRDIIASEEASRGFSNIYPSIGSIDVRGRNAASAAPTPASAPNKGVLADSAASNALIPITHIDAGHLKAICESQSALELNGYSLEYHGGGLYQLEKEGEAVSVFIRNTSGVYSLDDFTTTVPEDIKRFIDMAYAIALGAATSHANNAAASAASAQGARVGDAGLIRAGAGRSTLAATTPDSANPTAPARRPSLLQRGVQVAQNALEAFRGSPEASVAPLDETPQQGNGAPWASPVSVAVGSSTPSGRRSNRVVPLVSEPSPSPNPSGPASRGGGAGSNGRW